MEWAGEMPEASPGEEGGGPSPAEPPAEPLDLDARLSAIEDLCVALGQRMDGLETTLRETLVTEVRAVNADLRHNVSELGRLLVRDLGRLSKLLDHHREAIVADLRPPPPPPEPEPEPDGEPGASPPPDEPEPVAEDAPPADSPSRRRRGRKTRRP